MLSRFVVGVVVVSASLAIWLAPVGTTRRSAAQAPTPEPVSVEVAATLAAIMAAPEIATATGTPAPEVAATIAAILSGPEIAAILSGPEVQATLAASMQSPTPEPRACDEADIQPRTMSELANFIAEAGEVLASPVGTPQPASVEVPVGQPADAQTATAVVEILHDEAACFNEGNVLHAFAYSSDERFRRDPTFISMPDRINHFDVIAVTNVSVLPDGRVGAIGVFTLQPGGPTTKYCIFTWDGARWLIDETIVLGGA